MEPAQLLEVGAKRLGETGGQERVPLLLTLTVAHRKNRVLQIDIPDAKPDALEHANA
jgi:hypothetical protein